MKLDECAEAIYALLADAVDAGLAPTYAEGIRATGEAVTAYGRLAATVDPGEVEHWMYLAFQGLAESARALAPGQEEPPLPEDDPRLYDVDAELAEGFTAARGIFRAAWGGRNDEAIRLFQTLEPRADTDTRALWALTCVAHWAAHVVIEYNDALGTLSPEDQERLAARRRNDTCTGYVRIPSDPRDSSPDDHPKFTPHGERSIYLMAVLPPGVDPAFYVEALHQEIGEAADNLAGGAATCGAHHWETAAVTDVPHAARTQVTAEIARIERDTGGQAQIIRIWQHRGPCGGAT